jgi:hypothetical protein
LDRLQHILPDPPGDEKLPRMGGNRGCLENYARSIIMRFPARNVYFPTGGRGMPISFICPYCGRTTNVGDEYAGQSGPCAGCRRTIVIPVPGYRIPHQEDIGQNAGIRLLLPVGRSVWAILAGYMGLFSLLVFPAPLALLLGIVAIVDIRKHPEKHGMGRAIFAIIMGLIGTVLLVIGIIAILSDGGPRGRFH